MWKATCQPRILLSFFGLFLSLHAYEANEDEEEGLPLAVKSVVHDDHLSGSVLLPVADWLADGSLSSACRVHRILLLLLLSLLWLCLPA